MARVRDGEKAAGPVRVTGQIFGAGAGQTVVVTLDRQCTWRGQLVPLRLETATDGWGVFILLLPPNTELATVDGQPAPQYVLQAPGVRRLRFVVPAGSAEWRLEL